LPSCAPQAARLIQIGEITMRMLLLGLLASLGLTACETIQGVGRDVQDAGQAIESAVES
jgi:predicted small secreted protein